MTLSGDAVSKGPENSLPRLGFRTQRLVARHARGTVRLHYCCCTKVIARGTVRVHYCRCNERNHNLLPLDAHQIPASLSDGYGCRDGLGCGRAVSRGLC